jgi:hypothetical protein
LLYVTNPGLENFYSVLAGRYGGQNMEFRKLSKNSINSRDINNHGLILEGVYKIELDTKTEYGGF